MASPANRWPPTRARKATVAIARSCAWSPACSASATTCSRAAKPSAGIAACWRSPRRRCVGMAIAIGLAATAYVARNDAQRRQAQAEDILGFMLGDLREKLTTVGRLDLMRAVDDKATAYFATLKPRDLSDRALEEQARSLTGIGQVRLDEGKHDEAMAAFREAYDTQQRAGTIASRATASACSIAPRPSTGSALVYWRKGRLDDAADMADALSRQRAAAGGDGPVAISPGNARSPTASTTSPCSTRAVAATRQAEQALRSELALFRQVDGARIRTTPACAPRRPTRRRSSAAWRSPTAGSRKRRRVSRSNSAGRHAQPQGRARQRHVEAGLDQCAGAAGAGAGRAGQVRRRASQRRRCQRAGGDARRAGPQQSRVADGVGLLPLVAGTVAGR